MSNNNTTQVLSDVYTDVFASPEYDAIFSKGMVVTLVNDEAVIKPLKSSEDAYDPLDFPVEVSDSSTITSLSLSHNSPDFSYFVETTDFKLRELLDTFCTNYSCRKKNVVSYLNYRYSTPIIKAKDFSHVVELLNIYLSRIKIYLDTTFIKDSTHYINVEKTFEKVKLIHRSISSQYKLNDYQQLFLHCMLLEDVVISSDIQILSDLSSINTIITNGDLFIEESDKSNCISRSNSMVPDDIQSGTVSINYNLNLKQIESMVLYILSNDNNIRLESKIHLLSSTSDNTRTDIVTRPIAVLLQCFREYMLSPIDIISIGRFGSLKIIYAPHIKISVKNFR